MNPSRTRSGFTLIELLTVIAIIAILMSLITAATQTAKLTAQKTQARNDLTQLVAAINNFRTEYGCYPIDTSLSTTGKDAEYGDPAGSLPNSDLVNVLRADLDPADSLSTGTGTPLSINTRQVNYLSIPFVKDLTSPKYGLGSGKESGPYSKGKAGTWYDPWGAPYIVAVDANGDGYTQAQTLGNYSDLSYVKDATGVKSIQMGAIGASLGADHAYGKGGNNVYKDSDDVLTWQ